MSDITVAAIINEDGDMLPDGNPAFRLVITAGQEQDISKGQRVQIYRFGAEIIDPKNGASLGKLEIPLGTGLVTLVQEKFSTVRSDMNRRAPKVGLFALQMAGESELVSAPFGKVQVGDLVRLI